MTDAEVVDHLDTIHTVLLGNAKRSKAGSSALVAPIAILVTPAQLLTVSMIDQPVATMKRACEQYQPLGYVLMQDASVTTVAHPDDRPAIVFIFEARSGYRRTMAYPYEPSLIGPGVWHEPATEDEIPTDFQLLTSTMGGVGAP